MQSEDGAKFNIHLGPEKAVDHVVDQRVIGQAVTVDAFRTERLPDDAYIAKSLHLGDKVIHLRDDDLRPSWAYTQGKGQGRSHGAGQGRGKWGSCW